MNSSNQYEILELHISKENLVTFALLAHEDELTLNDWIMKAVTNSLEEKINDTQSV